MYVYVCNKLHISYFPPGETCFPLCFNLPGIKIEEIFVFRKKGDESGATRLECAEIKIQTNREEKFTFLGEGEYAGS